MAPATGIQHDTTSRGEVALIFARLMGLLSAAVGAAVLVGWHLDEPLLKQGFSSSLTMPPNAAAGFIMAGLGLLALTYRRGRFLARLAALGLLAGAGATLSQDVAGWDIGIDMALLPRGLNPPEVVGSERMSPGAALAFILVGCVLFLTARRNRFLIFLTEVMLVAILVLAIINLIGHSYEFTQQYNPFPFTAMPIHMGIVLALTAAGLSAACPGRGFARAVIDASAGGQMIRRLLPGIVIIPILLGWFVHRGLLRGIYSDAVGIAVFAVATIVIMAGFIWMTSVALRRSDRERQEALIELHAQRESLRTTLESIADAVMATDHTGSIQLMNPVAEKLTGWTLKEARSRPVPEVFHVVDETTLEPVDDPIRAAQAENNIVGLYDDILIKHDESRIPVEYTSSPIRNTRGRVAGAVLIFRDITERRRAEQQQQMLVSELNHRVRNVLMIVQSLVQASAQHTEGKSAEEMSKVLVDRLQSLSRAHELLLDTQWSGASLKQMVERELEPFRQGDGGKVTLRGRDVLLPPQSTSMVAMALHELTTNAVKYGALATSEGRLKVNWNVRGDGLTIKWVESRVTVREQRKSGFGMRMIDKGIRQNLGGDTSLEFREDGLAVTMRVPLGESASGKTQRSAPAGTA